MAKVLEQQFQPPKTTGWREGPCWAQSYHPSHQGIWYVSEAVLALQINAMQAPAEQERRIPMVLPRAEELPDLL